MRSKFNINFLSICCITCLFVLFTMFLVPARAEETNLNFERMWPVLDQPWYFKFPKDIAVDANGNFYVIDLEVDSIQKFTSDGQFISKWGVRGSEDGEIFSPESVAVDDSGNVYVADRVNFRIQKFTSDGQYVTGWNANNSGIDEYIGFTGIDIDYSNMIYVTDNINHRIQKFTSDGTLVTQWGSPGSGDGQLDSPSSITSDNNGNIYVIDAGNHRVQKFTSDGTFVLQWGQHGDGNEEFDFGSEGSPVRGSICVDATGFVYVSDTYNSCIKKFTSQGEFVKKYGIATWQYTGTENLVFESPSGLDVDSSGYIYIADVGNPGITKFSDTQFSANWGGAGRDTGTFDNPSGIALDEDGYVYISDAGNDRIQKFSSTGTFISTWGENGGAIGDFDNPRDIAADYNGNIYITDTGNNRIQKFTSDGSYLTQWGSDGHGQGEFSEPQGIAVDSAGIIYVADTDNYRIQKFSSDGTYLSEWGMRGTGDGQFEYPTGIAVDNDGNVYVADENNDCVHKFTSDGIFITKFSGDFNTDEQINDPCDVDTDDAGNVYVADQWGTRILIFNSQGELIEVLGSMGYDPGMFSLPVSLAVLPSGNRLYVGESPNNRIQVFSKDGATQPDPTSGTPKAILVAGGGPYTGNNLWDATQLCTNYAFRALTFQGYTKDTIYYLTSDTDLDLDGNGILDDVDADATNANLQTAITSWAADASDLTIYITDHGGDQNFRMGELELLTDQDLNTWLNQLQAATNMRVIIIYDACESGSFLAELASTVYDRIFIASTSQDQQAYFTSMGQISFSYFFWGNIFNGMSLYDSYLLSQDAVEYSYSLQTPLLNADGNDTGNEDSDMDLIQGINIGNGVVSADDIPVIGSISDTTTLNGETQASIFADNVIDANGISRVWAIITPPDDGTADPSNPVLDLPEIELTNTSGNLYEGSYDGFSQRGTYNVAVFAMDTRSMLSIPKSTQVIQTAGLGYSTLNSALNMTISCVEFQGVCYQITLEYYSNSSDTLNLFWKLDINSIGINQTCDSDCASMDSDLQITIPKIEFEGNFYQSILNKYLNPIDPFGFYWMLDLVSVQAL
jgi:sugar lactone lactonase YvrE